MMSNKVNEDTRVNTPRFWKDLQVFLITERRKGKEMNDCSK